ncbi:MAG: winged helix-turn-helix transcriptional regulator [Victivallales bacterium]|nr:winged helix-turn-helix transcriptional regulator [Victivallales bacterium]
MSKAINMALINEKARIFKALGHPTRLMFVEKLAGGECCVCELVELAGVDFSTVSKHLSILKEAGIISDDKRGKKVFYRLSFICVTGFMECIETSLRKKLDTDSLMFV